jgi:hypothetical protein
VTGAVHGTAGPPATRRDGQAIRWCTTDPGGAGHHDGVSSANEPPPDHPGMSHPQARRRGRFVLPGIFVLGIVVVFLIIILVGNFL